MGKIARKKSEGGLMKEKLAEFERIPGQEGAGGGKKAQEGNPPSLLSHFSLKFSKKFKNFSKFPSKLN